MMARAEFSEATKRKDYERRAGICGGLIELKMTCDQPIAEYDHIKRNEIEPDNSLENCRGLCRAHHLLKNKLDTLDAKKGRHVRKETKKSHKPKAKIQSRGFMPKEKRRELRERHAK